MLQVVVWCVENKGDVGPEKSDCDGMPRSAHQDQRQSVSDNPRFFSPFSSVKKIVRSLCWSIEYAGMEGRIVFLWIAGCHRQNFDPYLSRNVVYSGFHEESCGLGVNPTKPLLVGKPGVGTYHLLRILGEDCAQQKVFLSEITPDILLL